MLPHSPPDSLPASLLCTPQINATEREGASTAIDAFEEWFNATFDHQVRDFWRAS